MFTLRLLIFVVHVLPRLKVTPFDVSQSWISDSFNFASHQLAKEPITVFTPVPCSLQNPFVAGTMGTSNRRKYHSESLATYFRLMLLMAGDIESNPGPQPDAQASSSDDRDRQRHPRCAVCNEYIANHASHT